MILRSVAVTALRLFITGAVLVLTFLTSAALVFGAEPARTQRPLPWTLLPFGVLLLGLAYLLTVWKARAEALVFPTLIWSGILALLVWNFRPFS